MAHQSLITLLLAFALPLIAHGLGGTWSFSSPPALGKSSGLPDLQYTRVLYNHSTFANKTACIMVAFDAIYFDGKDIGAPYHHPIVGMCSRFITLRFGVITHIFSLTFEFSSLPIKGTNVSSIVIRQDVRPPIIFLPTPETAMVAKRDKCYDCDADLVYHSTNTSDPHTLTIHHVRMQAFIPHAEAATAQFSSADPASICPKVPSTGFDAALYFGIGIGVLGAVGILAFVRHACMSRYRNYKTGYLAIQAE